MTSVPDAASLYDADLAAAGAPVQDASDTVVGLLPPRAAVLDRLAERLPSSADHPATLLVVGLRRRDDGWPIPAAALARITTLLAQRLRADDWLARSGPTEFVVLVAGPVTAAQQAASRLVQGINAEALRGMSASAGLAALVPGLSASEVLRRATLCLTTARTIGAGQVITYSGAR